MVDQITDEFSKLSHIDSNIITIDLEKENYSFLMMNLLGHDPIHDFGDKNLSLFFSIILFPKRSMLGDFIQFMIQSLSFIFLRNYIKYFYLV